ncbi:MAG: hypothetical protein PHI35_06310 [Victivallaceae bacterium]|nr:hypothetical protein [Victivallaceae bacterium]
MTIETKTGFVAALENIDLQGHNLMTREELINAVREAGADAADDARIAVFVTNDYNEICYAVDGDFDWMFYEDDFFTPDDRDELIDLADQATR